MSLTPLKENIIEISWLFQDLAEQHLVAYNGPDTRETICRIADEFEEEYKDVDWNAEGAPFYIEEIQNFAKKKLLGE